jgi:hypothetical protein
VVEKPIRSLRHAERGDQSELPVNVRFTCHPSFLTIDEEDAVLQLVRDCQCHGECPTSPEVRYDAAEVYKLRKVTEKPLGREWWKSFTCRHKAEMMVVTWASQEEARAQVVGSDVIRYFDDVLGVIRVCRSPKQPLNMGKNEPPLRPSNGRRKKVVAMRDCPVEPHWSDR